MFFLSKFRTETNLKKYFYIIKVYEFNSYKVNKSCSQFLGRFRRFCWSNFSSLWNSRLLNRFKDGGHFLRILFFFFISGIFRVIFFKIHSTFFLLSILSTSSISKLFFFFKWSYITRIHNSHDLFIIIQNRKPWQFLFIFQKHLVFVIISQIFISIV